MIYEVPFQMLADNPTIYREEQESTDFITSIFVTYDKTVPLGGEVLSYVSIARRKGETWLVGAITNWDKREFALDFSFLDEDSKYRAVVFNDGINADRNVTDYAREKINISKGKKLKIQLSNSGG